MVNNLLAVKPEIPLATDLKKWQYRQESLKQKMSQVRYGNPLPLKGIAVRLRLNSSNNRSRASSAKSNNSRRS